jgi:hypothetical protein
LCGHETGGILTNPEAQQDHRIRHSGMKRVEVTWAPTLL